MYIDMGTVMKVTKWNVNRESSEPPGLSVKCCRPWSPSLSPTYNCLPPRARFSLMVQWKVE